MKASPGIWIWKLCALLLALGCDANKRTSEERRDLSLETDCLQAHLTEAMELNEARLPRYEKLSQGRSREISGRLIQGEKNALQMARYIDDLADKWQEQGVAIVCQDLVSMSLVPAFREKITVRTPLADYIATDAGALTKRLEQAFLQGGFAVLSRQAETEIEDLKTLPAFHCMVRHLLESLLRVSNLATVHLKRAAELGLEPTADLSLLLIQLHEATLSSAAELDTLAAPLQAEGLPILCQDVPPIAPTP